MSDSFTETTRTSYGSRLKNAIGGILGGIILIVGGIWLLSWNEGRTIKTKKALQEGAEMVVNIDSIGLSSDNEGKLVHLTGMALTDDVLTDNEFGISANAIHLKRNVEMYQWVEKSETKTEKKLGGAEEKTTKYTYNKKWSSSLQSSSDFRIQEGHQNPSEFAYSGMNESASYVTLKDFVLAPSLINKIGGYSSLDISGTDVSGIENAKLTTNKIYIGKGSEQSPQIGDMRITYQIVKPQIISVVGQQNSNNLGSFSASNGKEISMVSTGVVSADQMFTQALKSNKLTGNLLRIGGLLALIIGFSMLFKPLVVLADFVPLFGRLVGAGTGFIAFILGLSIGLVTIAIAWIAYRPFVAIPLLVIVAGLLVLLVIRSRKKRLAA